jgi:uncharacterized protein YvpB
MLYITNITLAIFISTFIYLLTPKPAEALRLVKLTIPYHKQEYTLSCEIAALKMALGGVSAHVSEAELITKLPFDRTPKRGGTWGDPYTAFVGNINGRMMITGYGVYWEPIARLGLRYRRTETLHNAELQDITKHIDAGRPVIIWGFYGGGHKEQWRTPGGRAITGVHGEHARVVVGYTGETANPDNFILYDPIYGELHWNWNQLWENWSALERGGVAVYPHPRWIKTPNEPTIWEINKDGKTRHGIAMTWERFLSYGGVPEGVISVGETDIEQFSVGPTLE